MGERDIRQLKRAAPGTAPACKTPAPVPWALRERFQRSLGPTTPEWPTAAPVSAAHPTKTRTEPAPVPVGEPTGESALRARIESVVHAAPNHTSEPLATSSLPASADKPQAPTNTRRRARRPTGSSIAAEAKHDAPSPVEPVPCAPVGAPDGLMADEPPGWYGMLAQAIASLCLGSDPAFRHWTVQVPLDPAALPETSLALSLSLHSLQLRFSTQSAWSMRLLSMRSATLADMLHQALPSQRDIDIELS